jgi:hypothetical protein
MSGCELFHALEPVSRSPDCISRPLYHGGRVCTTKSRRSRRGGTVSTCTHLRSHFFSRRVWFRFPFPLAAPPLRWSSCQSRGCARGDEAAPTRLWPSRPRNLALRLYRWLPFASALLVHSRPKLDAFRRCRHLAALCNGACLCHARSALRACSCPGTPDAIPDLNGCALLFRSNRFMRWSVLPIATLFCFTLGVRALHPFMMRRRVGIHQKAGRIGTKPAQDHTHTRALRLLTALTGIMLLPCAWAPSSQA